MVKRFKFEKETYSEIKPIPLSTQYRLDAIGVKLCAETWNELSQEDQLLFSHFPLRNDGDKKCYRTYLLYLLKRLGGSVCLMDVDQVNRAKDEWENLTRVPPRVYQMIIDLNYTLSRRDWTKMSDFKRYVLVKLSQGNHPSDYLNKALAEMLPAESKVSSWKSRSENCSAVLFALPLGTDPG